MGSDVDPRREYTARLEARRRLVQRHESNDRLVAVLRLVTAFCFAVTIWLSLWRDVLSRWTPLIPVVIFFVLVVIHEQVFRAKRRALRAVRFYEDGLARIEDRWIGRGQSTEIFRDESHLYAADLDIFGKASLFELLCTARMRGGEETLAAWLAGPTNREEIIARQEAVRELRDNNASWCAASFLDSSESHYQLGQVACDPGESLDPSRITCSGHLCALYFVAASHNPFCASLVVACTGY